MTHSSRYAELRAAGQSGSVFTRNASQWPLLLKACHITQGEMHSVKLLPSQAWLVDNKDRLQAWLLSMWRQKPDDKNRVWTTESNSLTDVLSPGFMLQAAVGSWKPVEGSGEQQAR